MFKGLVQLSLSPAIWQSNSAPFTHSFLLWSFALCFYACQAERQQFGGTYKASFYIRGGATAFWSAGASHQDREKAATQNDL